MITRRALFSLLVAVGPFVLALTWWVWASPRTQLLSSGDGSGVPFPDRGTAEASQLMIAILVFSAATIASTTALWRRHRALTMSRMVAVSCATAVACVLTATAATPLAELVLAADPATPEGMVVSLPPTLGAPFIGPLILFTGGLSWESLPDASGWLVLGALCAASTIGMIEYLELWGQAPDTDE